MNLSTGTIKTSKPPYLLGLLGLIPLVGFFVGIALVLFGIIKYKDRKLIIIGIASVLFSVLIYWSLFYFGFKSDFVRKQWAQHSQFGLTSLIQNVEFYKLENNRYPDSLEQLISDHTFITISDPLQSIGRGKSANYIYKNLGNTYLLFSSGIDGVSNTADDIYPEVIVNDNIGWRRQ